MIVVIGIILLVAAILLPVLSAGKQAAHDSRTLQYSNQIGKASLLYATDYGDHFPHAASEWVLKEFANNRTVYTPEKDARLPKQGLLEALSSYTSSSIFFPWVIPDPDAEFLNMMQRDPSPFFYYRDEFVIEDLPLQAIPDPSKESLVMEREENSNQDPSSFATELLACLKVDTSVKRLPRAECWNTSYVPPAEPSTLRMPPSPPSPRY